MRCPIRVEERLQALGLSLPPALDPLPDVVLPFAFARPYGDRVFLAGHGSQAPNGSLAGPFGTVGEAVSVQEAYQAARLTALSMLGSLQRELGDLDRVTGWLRVFGMVNAAAGFSQHPAVINGFSDLILELYGPDAGSYARAAVGMASLPFDLPVEVEAEVAIRP